MNLKRWFVFLALLGTMVAVYLLSVKIDAVTLATPKIKGAPRFRETMFYEKLKDNTVQCGICFRRCIIPEGKRGFCRNRENRGGILYNLVYAKPSAVHIDPIEKEPALHMLPGTQILCFGTAGCNFRCKFCHNWHLSQRSIEEMDTYSLLPEDAVNLAIEKKIPTLSFTYNEPTSFYEYVYDIAKLAKAKGLKILWHSNGSMSPQALKELLKYTDSVTIDLKGFTERFYHKLTYSHLNDVLDTLIWLIKTFQRPKF